MLLPDRLKEARLNKGMKQEDLAKALGKSKGVISHWEKGDNKPDAEMLFQICDILEVNPNWLLGWKDVSLSMEEQDIIQKIRNLKASDRDIVTSLVNRLQPEDEEADYYLKDNEVPYRTMVLYGTRPAAGSGNYLPDSMAQSEIQVIDNKKTKKADFALKVDGHSMEPKYTDGDTILVKHQDAVDPGEIGVFLVNGQAVVKQCQNGYLHSLNPNYEDIQLHENDEVVCFGKVIGKL